MQDTKELLKKYTPKAVTEIKLEQQLGVARFSPCGKVLAAGTFEGQVRRWDASSDAFAALPVLAGHHGWVQGLVFHPDARRMFSADSWGQLRAWSYADGKTLWSVPEAHDGWIRKLVLSPDGKRLASCGRDLKVRFWSTDSGNKLGEVSIDKDPLTVAFTPDGKGLLIGDLFGVVTHWDLDAKKVARTFDAKTMHYHDPVQEVGGVRCLAFDTKGELLAVGGGRPKSSGFVVGPSLVLFFDWKTGALKHTAAFGADPDVYVTEAVFHAEGFLMAVSSGQAGQGKLLFLRPGDSQPFFTKPVPNCHSLAIHPGGTRVAISATNGSSAGNGAVLTKDKVYAGNFSPLHVLDFPNAVKKEVDLLGE